MCEKKHIVNSVGQPISEVIWILSAVLVFIIVYLLFLISGFLFPIDLKWYKAIDKPSWTPPGRIIGVIWGILYGLIALSLAIVEYKVGLKSTGNVFIILWVMNYLSNQAFSYFEFKAKRLDLAALDTAVVAITAFLLIFATLPYSTLSTILLLPYLGWSGFATYLAYKVWQMNR